MDDLWNPEEANELLRALLVEIEGLAEQLSPARAEAVLDEFEGEIGHAFLSQDMRAVKVVCELYERRFRALALSAEQKELLQTLAVIGRESPLGLIRKVADRAEPQFYPNAAKVALYARWFFAFVSRFG